MSDQAVTVKPFYATSIAQELDFVEGRAGAVDALAIRLSHQVKDHGELDLPELRRLRGLLRTAVEASERAIQWGLKAELEGADDE